MDAQKILSAAMRTEERFGLTHVIDIVQGVDTEKIRKFKHDQVKTYGVGKDKSKKWWRGIVEELLSQEAVRQDAEAYNALKITEKGRKILFGKESFYILKREDSLPKAEIMMNPFSISSKRSGWSWRRKKKFLLMSFSLIKPYGR